MMLRCGRCGEDLRERQDIAIWECPSCGFKISQAAIETMDKYSLQKLVWEDSSRPEEADLDEMAAALLGYLRRNGETSYEMLRDWTKVEGVIGALETLRKANLVHRPKKGWWADGPEPIKEPGRLATMLDEQLKEMAREFGREVNTGGYIKPSPSIGIGKEGGEIGRKYPGGGGGGQSGGYGGGPKWPKRASKTDQGLMIPLPSDVARELGLIPPTMKPIPKLRKR